MCLSLTNYYSKIFYVILLATNHKGWVFMWIDILIPEATAAIVSFIMFLFSKNSEKKDLFPAQPGKERSLFVIH